MTSSLPPEVQAVFERFVTTEYTTIDARGRPITWPVIPYYERGGPCIDVTTGIGYPKKANDARANPRVALLFSDPTGSGLDDPPMVFVQGAADVDDRDLEANWRRYERESVAKLPGGRKLLPPAPVRRFFAWYFARVYVHVRPERVYVWPGRDSSREPALYGSHLEEVRSGHSEEAEESHLGPEGGGEAWDRRLDELGSRYRDAVLSFVSPDGFPFSLRLPVAVDRGARLVRIEGELEGAPLQPGLACLTAHDHAPDFTWQRNFQVRGDLQPEGSGWVLRPHRFVGGFELPPTSALARYRLNFSKMMRFRRAAKRELAARGGMR